MIVFRIVLDFHAWQVVVGCYDLPCNCCGMQLINGLFGYHDRFGYYYILLNTMKYLSKYPSKCDRHPMNVKTKSL